MRIFFIAIVVMMSQLGIAQSILGTWNGALNIQGMQLRLVIHIEQDGENYSGKLDSPDQGAFGIPATTVTFQENKLDFAVESIAVSYSGELGEDEVVRGKFMQMGQEFPLDLSRAEIEKVALNRPQEPKPPYPYKEIEVKFKNEQAGITLAGTLTLPKKKSNYPVVVLITGSGPQDRNEEILGHKPFWIIADFLTRNNIAVLRFDDRGVGESQGNFKTATTYDFATDVEAAVNFLKGHKRIDATKIGLIGHSEGGIIAPMVASQSNDVAFIVLLAGTGLPGSEILLLQQELIARADGDTEENIAYNKAVHEGLFEIMHRHEDPKKAEKELTTFFKDFIKEHGAPFKPTEQSDRQHVNQSIKTLTDPWMYNFIRLDPREALRKVSCPVLAINGSKDLQVPPKENLAAIEAALKEGGNTQVTIKELPDLNHLFQTSETGSPAEYMVIEETFSPIALEIILNWLKEQL